MTATPRPWHIEDVGYDFTQLARYTIEPAQGVSVWAGSEQSRADAELIVRAVNNFEPLVEALKLFVAFDEYGGIDGYYRDFWEQAIKSADTALRQAGALD